MPDNPDLKIRELIIETCSNVVKDGYLFDQPPSVGNAIRVHNPHDKTQTHNVATATENVGHNAGVSHENEQSTSIIWPYCRGLCAEKKWL
jgi:hypothetical protein